MYRRLLDYGYGDNDLEEKCDEMINEIGNALSYVSHCPNAHHSKVMLLKALLKVIEALDPNSDIFIYNSDEVKEIIRKVEDAE